MSTLSLITVAAYHCVRFRCLAPIVHTLRIVIETQITSDAQLRQKSTVFYWRLRARDVPLSGEEGSRRSALVRVYLYLAD